MIGQVLLTVPLLTVALYGWSTSSRSRAVGIAVIVTAVTALCFVWVPSTAAAVAGIVHLGTPDDLILYAGIALAFLILLDLHLLNRRQTEVVTALIREIALTDQVADSNIADWRDLEIRPPIERRPPERVEVPRPVRRRPDRAAGRAPRDEEESVTPRG